MAHETLSADVVIVGAGPAGSTTAAILARRGYDVLLLDRASFPRDKTCGDGLTPRAIPVLERLGMLSELQAAGYQQIAGARLVAPDRTAWHLRFGDYDVGLPPLGLVIPRFELDERLRQRAIAQGAQFLGGVHVTAPIYAPQPTRGLRDQVGDFRGQEKRVIGVRGEANAQAVTVRARLTVLATGASIGLLRALGVLNEMPPGVNAIRGYFTGVADLSDEFEFYFDRELLPGYGWIFPLGDGRANVGLGAFSRGVMGSGPNVRKLLAEFIARQPRLRDARPDGPPKGYPLRIDFPRYPPAGEGFLLVGEALGLVNPVTGEGIDLALESAEMAADAVGVALRRGKVDRRALTPYARALNARFGSFFRGVHLLLRLATGPRALNVLIRKAKYKPHLARAIAGINLGVTSPWIAFSPRTWWDILT